MFVSYAHENDAHKKWVEGLAKRLRESGVDARVDFWDLNPGYESTRFMESLRDADVLLLICSPLYAEKSNTPKDGVGYEKSLISDEMLKRGLDLKVIPVLRSGEHKTSLPTYLGSRYAVDFREDRDFESKLEELLRGIYNQPHPEKPPLGQNPFADQQHSPPAVIQKDHPEDAGGWHRRARQRFDDLRREIPASQDPFRHGFWYVNFVLRDRPPATSLAGFVDSLRASVTNRTGWNVGWVPTRSAIAPYPFEGGVEVWLAEAGGKGAAHSDFWRAEPAGRFTLFRGYQEDESEYPIKDPGTRFDYVFVLWRLSEVLLYLERFAAKLAVPDTAADLVVTWTGLRGRRLGGHDFMDYSDLDDDRLCRQDWIETTYSIVRCDEIKRGLVRNVQLITAPLFELFSFTSFTEADIKERIRRLFDADREGG